MEFDSSVDLTTGKKLAGSQETVACDLGLSFAIRLTAPFGEKACLE